MKYKLRNTAFKIALYTGIGLGVASLHSCDKDDDMGVHTHKAEFLGGQSVADRETDSFTGDGLMRNSTYTMAFLDVDEKSISEQTSDSEHSDEYITVPTTNRDYDWYGPGTVMVLPEHTVSLQHTYPFVSLKFDCSTRDTVLLKQMYPDYNGKMTQREFLSSSQRQIGINFTAKDAAHNESRIITPKDVVSWYMADKRK